MTEAENLRYPIGRFTPVDASTAETRAAHIETLRLLPERLRGAVSGLNNEQLDTPYREGGWTVRQVVHHVADSHANAYIRCKLALTEEWPVIKTYNQKTWAELADSRLQPIDASLVLIEALHSRWTALLGSLREEDFQRGYNHPEIGPQMLSHVLAHYAWHARHHTAHIAGLRERKGW